MHPNPLTGLVEINKTITRHWTKEDPLARGRGRSDDSNLLIAGAVEIHNMGPLAGPGRIRLAAIEDFYASSPHDFMAAVIAPGSTAKTDGGPRSIRTPPRSATNPM